MLYNFLGDKMDYIIVLDLILKNKNLSIKELAEKTSLSESYLYRIRNCKVKDISLGKLCLIANALNIDVKNLFYTIYELPGQKRMLNKSVFKYGLKSKTTIKHSKILDRLLVLKLKKNIQS